jgi:hypothetical protein
MSNSFRVPNVLEYALPLVTKGMNDVNPYVRKTSGFRPSLINYSKWMQVIGWAKLYRISPSVIKGTVSVKWHVYNCIRAWSCRQTV